MKRMISGGWDDWDMWQYTSKLNIDGVTTNTVDGNWLRGTVDDFRRSLVCGR